MRVAICQPWLGHYRTPLYELLGAQPGVEITVFGAYAKPPECAPGPGAAYRFVAEPFVERRVGLINLRHQRAQLAVMDRSRFDLVIMPWDVSIWSVWGAVRKARRIGMPTILWGHGYSLHGGGVRDRVRNALGRRASAVMVYTKTVAERLISRHGCPRERVFTAQNALDQRKITAAREWWLARPAELAKFQREKGIDPSQTIIHVSRLVVEKRPAPLVRGLALLRKERPGARLVFVGDGPTRPDLERLVDELGQREAVTFAGSIYDETQLAPWMLSATLMCYPFSAGLSLLHSFGYGLPVVTGDRVGAHNPEIEALEDGQSGLFFRVAPTPAAEDDPASVEAMVGAWHRMLDDAALRARLSAGAGALARDEYTIERMAQGFLDAFAIADGRRRTLILPEGWERG